MSVWVCCYCRSLANAKKKPVECENCGGPMRRPTREEARRLEDPTEPAREW